MARLLAAIGLLLLFPGGAAAHSLHVFARVEGNVIRGEAYFRGRVPARQAKVAVFDPDGRRLAETTTDDEGAFVVAIRRRCDHRIVVDAGEGHRAEWIVSAAELPDDLSPATDVGTLAAEPSPDESGPPPPPAAGQRDLAAKLDALNRQMVELRKQIDEYEHRTRVRDVLGGLGYILGIAGAAYYVLARRGRREGGD
jgi:nickel transport protein